MPRGSTTRGGAYLYAIVPGSEEKNLGPVGLFEGEVHTVTLDGLAAVVSDLPSVDRLRPERRHLAAHQDVLSRLVEESDVVLPVSFGTVADSNESIKNMLSRYSDNLKEQMSRVEGKMEVEVHVIWDVPNVFEHMVKMHPELREARDRVFDQKHEPTRDEKIELGQLFERILNEDREALTRKMEEALGPHCSGIKRNKCRNEQEVMRLSCLIPKDGREEFEDVINKAAELFEDYFTIEHSGPYPAYNFIDVRLKI